MDVRPKKQLGQHFLTDKNIARKIASSLGNSSDEAIEVGPGTGILTSFLADSKLKKLIAMDIDKESIEYLKTIFSDERLRILHADFLNYPLHELFEGKFMVIGNFPYNISSQILFRVLEYNTQVTEVVGMFQKEVAERIISPPGSKKYGILSVLIQAYYDTSYLFTVHENVFYPPPKVKSAVISLKAKSQRTDIKDEKLFFRLVKTAFNQRRKTLRNSLKGNFPKFKDLESELLSKRPEQLSYEEFIRLSELL